MVQTITFSALGTFAALFIFVWARSLSRVRGTKTKPNIPGIATGLVTNFFDTLGIGSFATTTTIFKWTGMVPDELMPGTLNAGHTLPVIFQAFVYIALIRVDSATLVLMITGAVLGAWIGAGWVAVLPKRAVQLGMGGALAVAFLAMLMRQFDLFPPGGDALGLRGEKLVLAVAVNAFFAAISTLGIGFYAPCLTLVSLLGMNPVTAFPIMMGSAAFLMPVASSRFVLAGVYSPRIALGLTIGGLLGVPLAAFLVKSLPLEAVRWMVMAVVLYTSQAMLRSAFSKEGAIVPVERAQES